MPDNDNIDSPEAMLLHYVDDNGWEWRTVVKVMNRTFDETYTINQLKDMYKRAKTPFAFS